MASRRHSMSRSFASHRALNALGLARGRGGTVRRARGGCAMPTRARAGPSSPYASDEPPSGFTLADQVKRFARAKASADARVMDIDAVYDGSYLEGTRVLVTGANRGIGLALCEELAARGANIVATCRSASDELRALNPAEIIEGVDVTSSACCEKMAKAVSSPVDIVINNAGYFYEPVEKVTDGSLEFDEEMKMIDICALGPLRVTNALYHAGKIPKGGKIAMITSQGGSVTWREVQNPAGGDYGHHMSKAAANMGAKLLAQELKHEGIMVQVLHPGFNKTDMTAKYAKIWEIEGAVDASVGAKRVMHEIGLMTPEYNGMFINCEDGLQIPW
ncbi:Short-chain dehydrogenase/reductase SDR [Ostreococcus tauri]|uniref:Short-chain dehydrogenase/reductase SDR n=2 Tax=Ostreococcus tauri TaxID=70448 RepID=A0A090M895_OSTTA|nr:Short-chain dehydrogenase/reductase SDR [Ostreococcus tauri]CEG01329.1 Short-chain dehydrogenase/reductase SDR [Ostreococcus tauri]|eukprot:XP_003080598.2 Short-chain dehydrogenase/reductase SDR [Ostreococcus tauri]